MPMNAISAPRRATLRWRTYDERQIRRMDAQLRAGAYPCCPGCGGALQARPATRIARYLPLDASGFDLECRPCRRFRAMIKHTVRSLRLVRMRRLAAAVAASAPRMVAQVA